MPSLDFDQHQREIRNWSFFKRENDECGKILIMANPEVETTSSSEASKASEAAPTMSGKADASTEPLTKAKQVLKFAPMKMLLILNGSSLVFRG